MAVYGGIDLHSNNAVLALVDAEGGVLFQKRYPNELGLILEGLAPFRGELDSVVVESTYNWYWLVDGLMAAGIDVRLCNPAKADRYDGLKYADDYSDARWLAEMCRLGILPEGYIYPRAERAVRDLLRRRSHLVRLRTALVLSNQNLVARNTGERLKGNVVKGLDWEAVEHYLPEPNLGLAVRANVAVVERLNEQITLLEAEAKRQARLKPGFKHLKTVAGIGEILALTIMLETGDIQRFARPGQYASYCRCVKSERRSNDKKKGDGHRKAGNKYLAWAFVEAAHFAVRYHAPVQRFYQRKRARTNGIVAIKAVANKLARASFYVMRDGVPFDMERAF
ncbi:IS110 family transposase [Ectothiorhodospiraceae bacterium WFHF3C12]|nr:IS110 family transposase [Ectothiorhodospiraceae bacterium WFHF3C12]